MPVEPAFTFIVPASISLDGALGWILLLLTVGFLIHAAVATYHWFTYGSERSISLLSSLIYVGVGLGILLLMGLVLVAL
jgi:hypothetical protein